MAGTDLKSERKDLYAPRLGVFVGVVVPPMTFLAIEGSGDPNVSEDYQHAIGALFSASYAAKFLSKRESWCSHSRVNGGRRTWRPSAPETRRVGPGA